jgi:saccharopine dehydrogenase-like NADP-dependent oxidoreductase
MIEGDQSNGAGPNGPWLRVLVIGGYGVFGDRIAGLLLDKARLTMLIAGRSLARVQTFCQSMGPTPARLIPAVFDRDCDVDEQVRALKPDLIVDGSGPFQAYGDKPYRVAEAAIDEGVDYFDVADGADFVEGIASLDAGAKARGVTVLTDVSNFPVLTAAVIAELAKVLKRVDGIAGGIAPSPFAGVGRNVIRAIASYSGKPVCLLENGTVATAYGLTDTRYWTIAPPGRLPLGRRLFSLVDVPDNSSFFGRDSGPSGWMPRRCPVSCITP